MSYTRFRYIAYQVSTVGKDSSNKPIYRIPPGKVKKPPTLHGDKLSKLPTDAKTRIERLMLVMKEAYDEVERLGNNSNTLKIFVVPEFYFRPDNKELAYSQNEYLAIKDVLKSTIDNGTTFNNWLVICGTILWKRDKYGITSGRMKHKIFYHNTCVYVRGRWMVSPDVGSIEKTKDSTIDGLPLQSLKDEERMSAPKEFTDKNIYRTREKLREHVIKVSGIKCGIEICLEHILSAKEEAYVQSGSTWTQAGPGVLKEAINDEWTRGWDDHQKRIHLQLIPAGGMIINPLSVVVNKGKYVMRNDGYSGLPSAQLQKAKGYYKIQESTGLLKGESKKVFTRSVKATIPYDTKGIADMGGDESAKLVVKLSGDRAIPKPSNCVTKHWLEQSILIYDSITI